MVSCLEGAYANAKVCREAAARALMVMKVMRIRMMVVNAVVVFGECTAFWKT